MVKIGGGSGSSLEEAIVICDCTNSEGVHTEYKEIEKRFGKCKLIKQTLLGKNNRMYDKLEIEVNGRTIEAYFDITGFFGKFGLE